MIRLHEILKIVADLRDQGELELAHRVAGTYMDRLDSTELRFIHLAAAAELGYIEQVVNLLEGYLQTDRWFSAWFLGRVPELKQLEALPRYRRILQVAEEKEAQYWRSGLGQPIVQVPPSAQPPYPLLVAIHGNGFNPPHSASAWACAVARGWLVFHPAAKRLVGYGTHWWDAHEENCEIITEQVGEIDRQYPVDSGRVILGGFSKGGETAMVLTLQGQFGAKGFITVGAGGYYHLEPERWQPLLVSPPGGLRGVAMYSPYDWERAGGGMQALEMFGAAGIDIRLERYPAEGHVFPEDFPVRFKKAVEFLLSE